MPSYGEADERSARLLALGDVVAASPIGVIGVGVDGLIGVVNDHLSSLIGRTSAELVGRTPHDALHGPVRHDACPFEVALAAERPTEVEDDTFVTAAGTALPVAWIATPREGAGMSIIVRDDTVQRARAALDSARRESGRVELADARAFTSGAQWLAELSQTLTSTLDEDEVLSRLARVLTARLADFVVADRHDDAGGLRRVVVTSASHVGVDVEGLLGEQELGREVPANSPSYQVALRGRLLRLDKAAIYEPDVLGPGSQALMRALDADSVIVVPLVARERVAGAFALVRRGDRPPFDEAEEALAADIGRRAALALDNARLYRVQRDISTQLQFALLPPSTVDLPVATAVRYLPARSRYRVGGDWYDRFSRPGPGDVTALIIGDVAGHDLPAASTMASVRNLLRGVVVATGASCAGVVEAVDANLQALGVDGTASAVVMMAGRGEDGAWTLSWSNAGHLPPLLLTPDGEAELLDEVHGPILGTQAATARIQSTRTVPAGSTVVLYTDGLIESRDEDLDLSLARLRQSGRASSAELRADPEALLGFLVGRHQPANEDDTAVLVCHLPAD